MPRVTASSSNSIANQSIVTLLQPHKRTTNVRVCLVNKYECTHPHCVRARVCLNVFVVLLSVTE